MTYPQSNLVTADYRPGSNAQNFNPAESFPAPSAAIFISGLGNSASDATSNTSIINLALAAGGKVVIPPGKYYINATLQVQSYNELVLSYGAELIAIPVSGSNLNTFTLIQNKSANSPTVQITSLSGVGFSNEMCLITAQFAAAHNISTPFIEIKLDGADVYNGIWPIYDIPSSTTVRFLMAIGGGSMNPPPAAATAVTSSAQAGANFTTAANSFIYGQAVKLSGNIPTNFTAGTVYYVIQTGLTSTNIQLATSPFATVGISAGNSVAGCVVTPQYLGAAADGHIKITGGGTLNGNFGTAGFNFTNTTSDHGIVLRRVRNPKVDNITFRDIRKYCVMGQDLWHPLFQNIDADTGSDGVHLYGPCWNPTVENMTGTYGDDVAVFQTIDGNIYLGFMLGTGLDLGGDFFNGVMRNIRPRHTHFSAACTIYASGNAGGAGFTDALFRVRGFIDIDGVSIQDPNVVVGGTWTGWRALFVGGAVVNSTVDVLRIKNCYGPMTISNAVANGGGDVQLPISMVDIIGGGGDTFQGDVNNLVLNFANIGQLSITGFNHTAVQGNSVVTIASSNVTIGSLTFDKCVVGNVRALSATCSLLATSGSPTVSVVNIYNCVFNTQGQALPPSLFTGVPTINIVGGYGNGYKCLIEQSGNSQSLNVNIQNFTSNAPTVGLFNCYGSDAGKTAVWKLRVSGLVYSGTVFANQTGMTLSLYNPDASLPFDITKLARSAGSMVMHNGGTAAGTVVANNMCVCDATNAANSWKQLSNTTLVY